MMALVTFSLVSLLLFDIILDIFYSKNCKCTSNGNSWEKEKFYVVMGCRYNTQYSTAPTTSVRENEC